MDNINILNTRLKVNVNECINALTDTCYNPEGAKPVADRCTTGASRLCLRLMYAQVLRQFSRGLSYGQRA